MDEKPELNIEKNYKLIEQNMHRVRQFCLEAAGFVLVVHPFEDGRKMAMEGYFDVFSRHHPPIFMPPEGSPWYHVGDFWDGYFYTALVYWGLTLPSLLLPERFKYQGKSRFTPETIRLLTAFSMVAAGVIITEIQDPKDIPAGVLGAAVLIALHFSAEKITTSVERHRTKAVEALSKLAEKVATLPRKAV